MLSYLWGHRGPQSKRRATEEFKNRYTVLDGLYFSAH